MERLFCYVDESGQDSTAHDKRERVFIVAVAIFEKNRDVLDAALTRYERDSGKGMLKWRKTNPESRIVYWRLIVADNRFKRALCYSQETPPLKPEFDARTILSVAKAIQWRKPSADYTSDIFIDGISEAKQEEYANELRKIGLRVRRVHRVKKEQSNVFIRLADALAGLAREAAEGDDDAKRILQHALKNGIVTKT
jgi:hypothetical protein